MSFLSQNLSKIKPSPTIAVSMKAAELKAQGKDIISLGMGEPDFDTPDNIKEFAINAIKNGDTKYTAVDGTLALKDAIIAKFQKENNLSYERKNITVGTGAKQVLYNTLMATLNEGDEVIIPSPYWVSYPDMVLLAGGTPVIAEGREGNDFKITSSDLEKTITDKTKWLILNSPSNPTGSCYSQAELKSLAEVLIKYPQVNIISDDIYEHLLFDDCKFSTIVNVEPKLKDRVLLLNGVSKAYAMTGWRIGFAAGRADLIKAISKIQSQSTSSPCSISQAASVEAMIGKKDFIAERSAVFQNRRNFVVEMLNNITGIECKKPNGAFYVFPSCKGLFGKQTPTGVEIKNCTDFSTYLLEEALVSTVPGVAFGAVGFFRISYAASDELLKKALERISKVCDLLK
ncbi:pyridoxal phosphate-dependent aminotransferase [Flavobacteriaceae bacterium]|nr:pyridoxal phosphate-dependent aminotransferase [Flavobacteriaceae bacterium]